MLTNKLVFEMVGAGLTDRVFCRTSAEAGAKFLNKKDIFVDDGCTL